MAAPKGNKFAIGNKGGQPAYYKNPEELELKCFEYFEACIDNKENATITGLALFLGFCHLNSLADYEAKGDEFFCIIKRAKLAVANRYENQLDSFKFGGAIFALCNIDKDNWKNSKDITSGGEKINAGIDLSKLSEETLLSIEADLQKHKK